MTGRRCGCCSGTGLVVSYTGAMRPCSRCRVEAFHEWYKALVAEAEAVPPPTDSGEARP